MQGNAGSWPTRLAGDATKIDQRRAWPTTRLASTCGHAIGQKIATPTTGFKAQPPQADRQPKLLILQSSLALSLWIHRVLSCLSLPIT